MRKRFLSIALAMVTALMIPLSACGKSEPEFDTSVFEGNDSYNISYNGVSGVTTVVPIDYAGENYESIEDAVIYNASNNHITWGLESFQEEILSMDKEDLQSLDIQDYFIILTMPGVVWDESNCAYTIAVACGGIDGARPGVQEFVVRIGQKSYVFSECKATISAENSLEGFIIVLNEDVAPFMENLVEHQDDEIRVRIVANMGDMEFSLSDNQKKDIIELYKIFDRAGGTNKAYMEDAVELITETEELGEYYNQQVEVRELYH